MIASNIAAALDKQGLAAPVLLDIRDLHVVRGSGDDRFHVHLPQLRLVRGEVAAIVGKSGCGKSTLLESLGLLLQPQHVQHFTLGEPALNLAPDMLAHHEQVLSRVRAQKLGFVLQNGGLLPYLSVIENITLPRRLLGLPLSAQFVEDAIDVLQLRRLLHSKPAALSIGERQRVACVRALAHAPQVLLADEPTAALDPDNARTLFQWLVDLVQQLGISAMVVSHDWALVQAFGLSRYEAVNHGRESHFERR